MVKTFKDYAEANTKRLEGYEIVNAMPSVNDAGTGIMFYLEREIGNATLGVEIIYNPENVKNPLTISQEYVKYIDE